MGDRIPPAHDAATGGARASVGRSIDLDAPAADARPAAVAGAGAPALHTAGLSDLLRIALDEATLDGLLRRVADAACAAMPVVAHASVTLLRAGVQTVASTSAAAGEMDETQYAGGGGPCAEAARTGARQLVEDATTDNRWPAFARAAAARGIVGALAVPLTLDAQTVGALNLYATSANAWTPDVVDAAEGFAGFASVALHNHELYADQLTVVAQLQDSMRSRAIIEQAKGVLMAAHRIGPDEAFEMLSSESQRSNRKVRDVAAELIISAGGIVPGTDDAAR
jgi:GAF domain-containing protein